MSEPSAASPATPRRGGPSIPSGTAFQAPHCAQAGTPRCPAASTRDWPPGTIHGGRGRQLKKQGKDCVQPWPESNIPEIMANKSESKQNTAIQHRDKEHESPCPQGHQATCFTMRFFQKKSEKISAAASPIPMPPYF